MLHSMFPSIHYLLLEMRKGDWNKAPNLVDQPPIGTYWRSIFKVCQQIMETAWPESPEVIFNIHYNQISSNC